MEEIKVIETDFVKNDMFYKVIKRNDKVVLLSINDDESFEVCRIYTKKGVENISTNSQFGIDGSKVFMNISKAEKWYDFLYDKLLKKNAIRYLNK